MPFRRARFHADLEEAMCLHRDLREQEQVERGLPPTETHYAVQRRFGNALVLREESRDVWGWNWLETFLQDIRYGLRQRRYPIPVAFRELLELPPIIADSPTEK